MFGQSGSAAEYTYGSLVPSPSPQLSSLAVRITVIRVLQATIAAVKDWERGYTYGPPQ